MEATAREHIAGVFDQWLREAPPFAAAFFGCEAYDHFLEGSLTLMEILKPRGIEGLVVDEAVWLSLGSPPLALRAGPDRFAWSRTDSGRR
jgi:hypothetical protein